MIISITVLLSGLVAWSHMLRIEKLEDKMRYLDTKPWEKE